MAKLKRCNVMLDTELIAALKRDGRLGPRTLSPLIQALLRKYAYNGQQKLGPDAPPPPCPDCAKRRLERRMKEAQASNGLPIKIVSF